MALAAAACLVPAPAAGQAQKPPAAAKPWSPPRMPDGQPDVRGEGYWAAKIGADEADDIEKGSDPIHATIMGRRPALPSNLQRRSPDKHAGIVLFAAKR
jgi:hypothetical protein